MLLPKLKSQRSTWRGSIRGTVFIWMCVFLSLSLPPSHPLSLSLTLLDNWVWPKREKNNPDIENYSSLSLGTVSLECDARAGLHWLTKATDAHLFPTLLFSEVIWVYIETFHITASSLTSFSIYYLVYLWFVSVHKATLVTNSLLYVLHLSIRRLR